MTAVFTIMFVCTGNICRSPMAELWTRAELDRRLRDGASGWRVSSAGTHALPGKPIAELSGQVLMEDYQIGPDHFRSSELTPALLRHADLVLTAERSHRHHVVDLAPALLKRSFTINEFGRVAPAVTMPPVGAADRTERARELVRAAARYRGTIRPERPEDDDIVDPIGLPLDAHREVGRQIITALDQSLTALLSTGRPARAGESVE